tara:strand:- start:5828 stop:6259 length:432 start_codon:yes stop_codon:yes gene_type:complete
MLDKRFFEKYGPDVVSKFRKHIFEDAKDVFGNKFKKYSNRYGKLKRADKFKRQASEFANSTAPVLTSDLLRDWKMVKEPYSSGFSFGTVAHGGKVKNLKRLGRVITTRSKPVPDGVSKFLDRSAVKYIKSKVKKNLKGGTFKI